MLFVLFSAIPVIFSTIPMTFELIYLTLKNTLKSCYLLLFTILFNAIQCYSMLFLNEQCNISPVLGRRLSEKVIWEEDCPRRRRRFGKKIVREEEGGDLGRRLSEKKKKVIWEEDCRRRRRRFGKKVGRKEEGNL